MKLTVFQSDKGDCLLITSKDGKRRVLVDGGMGPSYRAFVAPALGAIAANAEKLDLVYLSHIDQDHIAGVLQLFDDMAAWRVHEFQKAHGNPTHPQPRSPRPPEVSDIWHNAFHELVGDNAGAIGDLLAASASVLSGTSDDALSAIATQQRELATSIPEAIKLSRRIGADQLGVPLNRRFGGKLAFVRTDAPPPQPIRIGPLRIAVVGPFAEDLAALRADWDTWLANNQERLQQIQRQARRDAERLGTSDAATLLQLRIAQAAVMGDREKVTPPNLASLMLLVTETGRTLLLTGDGHAADIVKGLKFHNKLDAKGRIHVNVLKVQHHGSENNIDEAFVKNVTADHYVFCGNGEHENPDLRVVELVIDSRIGNVPFRTQNPKAAGPFKLWFNSSEEASQNQAAKTHMAAVQAKVAEGQTASGGRMSSEFLDGDTPSFALEV